MPVRAGCLPADDSAGGELIARGGLAGGAERRPSEFVVIHCGVVVDHDDGLSCRSGVGVGEQDAGGSLRTVNCGRSQYGVLAGALGNDDVEVVAAGHGAAVGQGEIDLTAGVSRRDLTAL